LRFGSWLLAFGLTPPLRQLFKLTNRKGITGESMAIEAKVLVDKWAARGLNLDVLVAIRFESFSIVEPKP
jgi:hypothetical protein